MAEKEKPAVLFTPPHHSNLQPIETVWAAVKGEVGRQYTAETTFQQVRDRLVTVFGVFRSAVVAGCIRKADKNLETLFKQVYRIEQDEEYSDDSGTDSESSSDGQLKH
ncbi:hypothetical protein PPTG_14692 [Phytophthora nicotianae INRA-310]|uniref:Tc1-like transposase DDE domain-containing protein n=1 Tax=Phytophthora nicotianae (strain INRA-310) TaxID=761204 RepID=W2PY65_PHYN3|nr:hypothetical protein PPTG_14692 [Phytophthora nicotianae INRA-310]ETN04965.1 hypothetical protein PPTG_14692 [Phytophthora nicotianae INRA-310]